MQVLPQRNNTLSKAINGRVALHNAQPEQKRKKAVLEQNERSSLFVF